MQTTNSYAVYQEFIAAEVLKLYGLAKDHSQKTDWQKMLKFGRKKRDRVDHILVGLDINCVSSTRLHYSAEYTLCDWNSMFQPNTMKFLNCATGVDSVCLSGSGTP